MAEYPIIMKQKNDQGNYDTLYPKTLGSQVQGNIQSSQIEGNIPSSQISGNIPSSQITGTFPASQITGLPTSLPANGGNADTVGNQTVQQIIQSALAQGMQVETGQYVGNGRYGSSYPNTLSFDFTPKLVIIGGNYTQGSNCTWPLILVNNQKGNVAMSGREDSNITLGAITVSWSGNSVSWYCSRTSLVVDDGSIGLIAAPQDTLQFNISGTYYKYIAIG